MGIEWKKLAIWARVSHLGDTIGIGPAAVG
jgi:hypothetical protein